MSHDEFPAGLVHASIVGKCGEGVSAVMRRMVQTESGHAGVPVAAVGGDAFLQIPGTDVYDLPVMDRSIHIEGNTVILPGGGSGSVLE